MRYLVVAAIAAAAAVAYAQPKNQVQSNGVTGRFQISVAPQGDSRWSHAAFVIDTMTGKVSYCFTAASDQGGMTMACIERTK